MKQTLKKTIEYARFVGRRFAEDRCMMVAGSLTYTSLLALVPVFAVTIALTAQVPLVRNFILEVKGFMMKNLLPDVGGRMVSVYMEQFAQNGDRVGHDSGHRHCAYVDNRRGVQRYLAHKKATLMVEAADGVFVIVDVRPAADWREPFRDVPGGPLDAQFWARSSGA